MNICQSSEFKLLSDLIQFEIAIVTASLFNQSNNSKREFNSLKTFHNFQYIFKTFKTK